MAGALGPQQLMVALVAVAVGLVLGVWLASRAARRRGRQWEEEACAAKARLEEALAAERTRAS